jgi:DNA-binding transcriptional MocR family regulator
MNSPGAAPWCPDLSGRIGPLYRMIAAALHDDIIAGRLPPGTRLPTHRDLAWKLKVTVGTITRAYVEAERQGLIGGEVGRGTFVRDPSRLPELPAEPRPGDNLVDLSVNSTAIWQDMPDLRAAMEAVSRDDGLTMMMGYTPSSGVDRICRAGAAWIESCSGLAVPVDRIVPAPGGQGAMHAAFAAATRPGDAVLVEPLTYPGVRPLAAQMGLRLLPVAMDGDGLIPEALEREATLHGARTLYCMPTLQNPTTITMPLERRQAIVAVARRVGLTIIEDDVYGFLDESTPPPLAALAPDVTVYITGLSKSLFPGLRAGYVVPPAALLARVVTAVRATVMTGSHLGAVVATELIESGAASRIARRRRAIVAERQQMARRCLGDLLTASNPACTHLWLTLPEHWRREALVRELLARAVKITPADGFAVGRGEIPQAVRICICSVERLETLSTALHVLADLLQEPAMADLALV